jgi:hypothetical protein
MRTFVAFAFIVAGVFTAIPTPANCKLSNKFGWTAGASIPYRVNWTNIGTIPGIGGQDLAVKAIANGAQALYHDSQTTSLADYLGSTTITFAQFSNPTSPNYACTVQFNLVDVLLTLSNGASADVVGIDCNSDQTQKTLKTGTTRGGWCLG